MSGAEQGATALDRSPSGIVVDDDGLGRCPWAVTRPLLLAYHDQEWGVPVRDERGLYERICLESFQAGLSWLTILAKRPAFRAAFGQFDPAVVAEYGSAEVELLLGNRRIVRNRAKIEAAIRNAKATLALRAEGGLSELIWTHRPERAVAPRTVAEIPSWTPESKRLSKALRAAGFAFVGPITTQALMAAAGVVDSHLIGCYRRGASGRAGASDR